MTDIEKLYENAGVKKDLPINLSDLDFSEEDCDELCLDNSCDECRYKTYPPFTAEKQIAIIKLISKQGQVIIENWENRGFNVTFRANSNLRYITMDCITRKTIEEALAQIVNDLWQDLTEQEQQQIKEILQ